jgi:hypothetical protein
MCSFGRPVAGKCSPAYINASFRRLSLKETAVGRRIFLKGNQEKGNILQKESKLQMFDSF